MLSPFVILRNEVTKNLFSSLPSFCHSEEQSDEESVFYRYCEDPSLTLRMTREETLTEILNFFWDTSAYVILRSKATRNLFSIDTAKILR